MILLRALARLVTIALLALLALAGLAAAVSSIRGGTGPLSLPWLAEQLHLADLRDAVASFRDGLEGSGTAPLVSALGGAAAVLVGLLLLAGLLVGRRERLVTLDTREGGARLTARRRPLGQVAATLVEQVRGVSASRVKVRPRRRGGGRMRVTAHRVRNVEAEAVRSGAEEALAELTSAFALRARVRARAGDGGPRVQ